MRTEIWTALLGLGLAALLLLLLPWWSKARRRGPPQWHTLPPAVLCHALELSGDLACATRALSTCQAWRQALRRSRRVWTSAVRLQGAPSKVRGEFWLYLVGTSADRRADWPAFETLRARGAAGEWAEAIRVDVVRTYLKLRSVPSWEGVGDAEVQRAITDVLTAMAAAFPSVGYCQGVDHLAVHVLRVLGPGQQENAFWLLCLVFDEMQLHQLYEPGFTRLEAICRVFEGLLRQHLPRASRMLVALGVEPEMYLVGWVQTLFVYVDDMSHESVSRVWDVMLLERSWKVVMRVSLAIVASVEEQLQTATLEGAMHALRHPPQEEMAADRLLRRAHSFKVTSRQIETQIAARSAPREEPPPPPPPVPLVRRPSSTSPLPIHLLR